MTANNAIYTPTPTTIEVVVYTDHHGKTKADSGPAHLVAMHGDILRSETAKVVARGNLCSNERERWYQIELADGSRHVVIGEGS